MSCCDAGKESLFLSDPVCPCAAFRLLSVMSATWRVKIPKYEGFRSPKTTRNMIFKPQFVNDKVSGPCGKHAYCVGWRLQSANTKQLPCPKPSPLQFPQLLQIKASFELSLILKIVVQWTPESWNMNFLQPETKERS